MRAEIKGGGKLMRRRNLKVALVNTVLAAIILGLYFALSLSHRAQPASVSGFPIYHGNNRKCVAIECAVTWDAAALDEILAVLEERGVRITFAVSGEWVERSPAMLKKIAAQGHEIATMGYAPSKDGGVDFVLKDIQKSLDCIESVLGAAAVPTVYYCGSRASGVSNRAAGRLGLTTVLCTLDLVCTKGSAENIFKRTEGNTNGGDILLAEPTAAFSKALPYILDYISGKGLTAGSVSGTIYD